MLFYKLRMLFLIPVSSVQATSNPGNSEILGPRTDSGDICAIVGQACVFNSCNARYCRWEADSWINTAAIVGGHLFFARGSYSFDGGDTLTSRAAHSCVNSWLRNWQLDPGKNLYSLELSRTFTAYRRIHFNCWLQIVTFAKWRTILLRLADFFIWQYPRYNFLCSRNHNWRQGVVIKRVDGKLQRIICDW